MPVHSPTEVISVSQGSTISVIHLNRGAYQLDITSLSLEGVLHWCHSKWCRSAHLYSVLTRSYSMGWHLMCLPGGITLHRISIEGTYVLRYGELPSLASPKVKHIRPFLLSGSCRVISLVLPWKDISTWDLHWAHICSSVCELPCLVPPKLRHIRWFLIFGSGDIICASLEE